MDVGAPGDHDRLPPEGWVSLLLHRGDDQLAHLKPLPSPGKSRRTSRRPRAPAVVGRFRAHLPLAGTDRSGLGPSAPPPAPGAKCGPVPRPRCSALRTGQEGRWQTGLWSRPPTSRTVAWGTHCLTWAVTSSKFPRQVSYADHLTLSSLIRRIEVEGYGFSSQFGSGWYPLIHYFATC